jgi:hypothetical protein
MAGKGHRVQIKMKSSASPHIYYLKKNKQNTPIRLELEVRPGGAQARERKEAR